MKLYMKTIDNQSSKSMMPVKYMSGGLTLREIYEEYWLTAQLLRVKLKRLIAPLEYYCSM